MKSFFKLREATAKERWNKAAEERLKKHDEIEAKRVAAAKQGKENMSGAIDKLSHVLYKEEKTPAVKKTKKSFREVHPPSESELNIQRGHSSSVTTEEVSHYSVHAFSSNLQHIGKPTKHATKDEADTEGHNYSAQGHVVVQHNKDGSKKVATASFEPGTGAFEKSEMKERALKEDTVKAEIAESLEEAKIGDKVQVIGGSQKGLVGHVGEIRKGLGGNHTYTVDYDDNGKRSSVQVKKAHTKVIKEVRSEYSKGAHDDDAQAFSGKAPYDYSKEPVTRTRISSSKDRSGKETHEVRQTHGKTYEVIASTHNTRQDAERAQAALRKKHGLSEETIQQMIEELQKQVND